MNNYKIWRSALGLALLYTSAFFLPSLTFTAFQIVLPSAVAVLVLTPLAAWYCSRLELDRSSALTVAVIALLVWIAVISAFSAAGYSALAIALLLTTSSASIEVTRWVRVVMIAVGLTTLIVAVHSLRKFWLQILRFLSILGYAYAILGLIRFVQSHQQPSAFQTKGASISTALRANPSGKERQVVWIIFDELDYNQTLGKAGGTQTPPMPNLDGLSRIGVSASNAYSPAKDTLASIPALLTGYALSGLKFGGSGLVLRTREFGMQPLQEPNSVFGRLPRGPRSAAIIGFYHPYCTWFPSVNPCVAAPDANVGRWFDALVFFGQPVMATARWLPGAYDLPGPMFEAFEPMYRITNGTLKEFPRFLSLPNKSLVYIHVNLPHPPADYSQRLENLKTTGDDREDYLRNLRIVDELIGMSRSILQSRSKDKDILLIVSSDHWHRIDSPLTPQRIPWIAWHVGESEGMNLDNRISTVHTVDLILDFLEGKIASQTEIQSWWTDKSFYPPLMPNGYDYDLP